MDLDHYLIPSKPYYHPLGNEISLFNAAYAERMPMMLKGPTGCGKTRFIEHMAHQLKKPLITVSCHEDMTASDLVGERISSVAHSILEIKCPQKMYSSIPAYYMVQLHMEMSAYNLKETFFVCWSQKDGIERTRVWKLNYNAGFFDTFVNDLVELFRALVATTSMVRSGRPFASTGSSSSVPFRP